MSYNYIKPNVNIPNALTEYLQNNYPLFGNMSYSDPDLTVNTTSLLTSEQETEAQTVVDNYVDPDEFLTLDVTTTDFSWSKSTNSADPVAVQTFIFSPNTPNANGSTFDALKTVMDYSTDDVSVFSNGPTGCTVTFQIYDQTRDYLLVNNSIDITDIVTTWQGLAQGGATGPQKVLRSHLVQGLRNLITNYDCIWQLQYGVTDPNVTVRSHGVQSLYYNIQRSRDISSVDSKINEINVDVSKINDASNKK